MSPGAGRRSGGFSLVELLVAVTATLLLLLAVLGAYSQVGAIRARVEASARAQQNVRLALGRLERELRLIGLGVPAGAPVGGGPTWQPAIFHATPTEVGFRADVDGGIADIVCTPSPSSVDCPTDELRLDSVAYHAALGCAPPDGAAGDLALVAVHRGAEWEPTECTAVDTAAKTLTVSPLTGDTFLGGKSQAVTIEQVYYRYVPRSQPPYGYLTRHVRYANVPDDAFPPTGASWDLVAANLTDFWLEYRDAAGATLAGNPLGAAERAAVRKLVLFLEGYDVPRAGGPPQLIRMRSEILLRNGP